MRDDDDEQLKIELLSQWKLEAEFRNLLPHVKSTNMTVAVLIFSQLELFKSKHL